MATVGELLVKIGVDIEQLGAGLADAAEAVKKGSDNIAEMASGAAARVKTAMSDAADMAKKHGTTISQSLKDVGGALTMGVTAPMVAMGGAAIKASTDMNAAMANIATLIPGNTKRIEELKNAAQSMATGVGKSAQDVADGIYQAISAFGDSADTVKIVEINAKAAAAGMATTTDAINLTSAVTKAYGDASAESVQKVADLAFQTVNLGQTTFPELAASMGKVVPLAATLKIPLEELFGQFSALTGVTGNTAEVSTQLRAAMQAILKPTTDMAKGFGSVLGMMREQNKLTPEVAQRYDGWIVRLKEAQANLVKVTDNTKSSAGEISRAKKALSDAQKGFTNWAAGMGVTIVETLGFNEALMMLAGRAGDNTNELGKMFGSVEALTAVMAIQGNLSDDLADKTEAMANANGATDTAFGEMTEGVNAAGFTMQQMQAQMSVLAQKLGDTLVPALSAVLNAITPLLDGLVKAVEFFSNLPAPVQQVVIGLAGLLAAVGPVTGAIGGAIEVVGKLGPAFEVAMTAGKGLMSLLAANPTIAIVVVIAAAVAAIVMNWDKIVAATKAALNWIGDQLEKVPAFGLVKAIADWVKQIDWSKLLEAVKDGTDQILKFFTALPTLIVTSVTTWGKSVLPKFKEFVDDVIEGFFSFFGMKDANSGATTFITIGKQLLNGLQAGIINGIKGVLESIKNVGNKVIESIKDVFGIKSPSRVMMDVGEDVVAGLELGIQLAAIDAVNAAKDVADAVGAEFGRLRGVLEDAVDILDEFNSLDIAGLDGVRSLAEGVAKLIGGDIVGGLAAILRPFKDLLEPILAPLGSALEELLKAVEPLVKPLAELLVVAVLPLVRLLTTVLTPVFKTLGDIIGSVVKFATDVINAFIRIYNATLGQLFGQIPELGQSSPPAQSSREFGTVSPAPPPGLAPIRGEEFAASVNRFVGAVDRLVDDGVQVAVSQPGGRSLAYDLRGL
jgi:hypothetical protein